MDIQRLRSMIRRHEGVKQFPYECSAKKLTIGIGHNLTDLGLPDSIIEDLFEHDLGNAISECATLYPNWHELPDDIQMVLVDMMFNLGVNRISRFKRMNRAIDDHNWHRMAEEMKDSRWYEQVGNRSRELVEIVRSTGHEN